MAESIKHTLNAEIRGARGPDRTEAGRRQHGDDGLRHIRHETDYPVSGADSCLPKRGCNLGRCREQFLVGKAPADCIFAPEDYGRLFIAKAQQVFGKVQAAAGEPMCSRHPGWFVNYLSILF